MSSESQTLPKRRRTASLQNREFQSPSDELSHVANIIERRRMQNRISQRNYRSKIRNRLEKLEAMVESRQSLNASREPTLGASGVLSENTDLQRMVLPVENHPVEGCSQRDAQDTCICPFPDDPPPIGLSVEDTELGCTSRGSMDMDSSLPDAISPFSTYMDTNGSDTLFIDLPSPNSLHCPTPTTFLQEEMPQLGSMSSTKSSVSGPSVSSEPHDQETPLASLKRLSTSPHQQNYDQESYPFPTPMGYPMAPLDFFATASQKDSTAQGMDENSWKPSPIVWPPGYQSLSSSPMIKYILVPTPVVMVQMQSSVNSQHPSTMTPHSRT